MYKKYIRFLSFVPAILLSGIIFAFSAQSADVSSDMSISLTKDLVKYFSTLFHLHLTGDEILSTSDQLHFFIRKAAHFTEYLLLSFSYYLPFYIYRKRKDRYLIFTIILCFLYAASDEIHQLFSYNRACQFRDVCLDTSGAAFGMLIIKIFSLFPIKKK